MSVTSGFYDAVNQDRLYDATQFTGIFGGIILEGVISSIGDGFVCSSVDSDTVKIGSGFAYFDGLFIHNKTSYNYDIPNDIYENNICYIVIELNKFSRLFNIYAIKPSTLDYNKHILLAKITKSNSNINVQNFVAYSDGNINGADLVTGIIQKTKLTTLLNEAPLHFSEFETEFTNEINDEFDAFIEENEYILYHHEGESQYDKFVTELNSKSTKPIVVTRILPANQNQIVFTNLTLSDSYCIDVKMTDYSLLIDDILVEDSSITIVFYNTSEISKEVTLVVNR